MAISTAARILDMVCNVAEEARFKDMKKKQWKVHGFSISRSASLSTVDRGR